MKASAASRQRWAEETKDPSRKYVVTAATWRKYSGEGKIHQRDCPAVAREIASAERQLESLTPYRAKHGGEEAEWPRLLSRQEAEDQNRSRCRVCAPDLPERVSKGSFRTAAGQFSRDDA